jgi:hypothetical protein
VSDYFKFYPKTVHTGRTAVDITRRTKILEDIAGDPYVFLPYTVVQDDRPEDIANYYYGDPNKVWLVYFANNIIDPYIQWPMTQDNFDKHLIKKYAEQANETGYAVLAWTKNETITENIVYFQNIDNPNLKINLYTYQNEPTIIQGNWRAIRIYEYESILNDNKRNIFLIDSRFAKKFIKDLEIKINE